MTNVPMATGMMATRFTENSANFTGNKRASAKTDSTITKLVNRGYKTLKGLAATNNTTVEKIAETVLSRSLDTLEKYIRYKGEVPVSTTAGIIAQAALLRMDDIATISAATDMSEDDALHEIEAAESEAVDINSADKENVLPPHVQASLNVVISGLLDRMQKKTGATDIKTTLALAKQKLATPLNPVTNPDNAIGDDLSSLLASSQTPTAGATVAPSAGTIATNPDDNSSSIWDVLDGIASTAQTVASAIKTVGTQVNSTSKTLSSTINNTGGAVVSSGISQYLSKNGLSILLILVVVVLLIIFIARAAKS